MSLLKLTLSALCLLALSSCSTPPRPAIPRLPVPPANLLTPPPELISLRSSASQPKTTEPTTRSSPN